MPALLIAAAGAGVVAVGEAQLCPYPFPTQCSGKEPTWIDPYCCTEGVSGCTLYKALRRKMPNGSYCYHQFTVVATYAAASSGYVEGTGTPVCY